MANEWFELLVFTIDYMVLVVCACSASCFAGLGLCSLVDLLLVCYFSCGLRGHVLGCF